MSSVVEVSTVEEFDRILSENPRVVVDFSALAWCVPCKQFAPSFHVAASKTNIPFVYVDVDTADPVLQQRYGVRSVPTVLLIEDEEFKILKGRTVPALLAELE